MPSKSAQEVIDGWMAQHAELKARFIADGMPDEMADDAATQIVRKRIREHEWPGFESVTR
jgi:hypothetical protein